jgi:D-alanyl-D-alanine carboxypeptidase/D-alanyl-D-alanine-endopeptidase (penicillin-binding protein 4)
VCGAGPRAALDENRALPPASVQKIVTSVAALDLLGPNHTFTTRLLADGPVRGGRLQGNLYLEGGGDPFLVNERLWLLAHDLAATGLRSVDGDLVVRRETVADLDSIRAREKTDSPYAAPVSRLAVDFNDLAFVVRPGERPGDAAHAAVDPFPIPGVTIENLVTTGAAGEAAAAKAAGTPTPEGSHWVLSGTVPAGGNPTWIYKGARDPAMLAGGVMAGLLAQNGITVRSVRAGWIPDTVRVTVIDSLPSLPLGILVRSMNSHSNNLMADLLLTDLGETNNAAAGVARIKGWLREAVGLDSLPEIYDGSGLSAENRISAAQIVRLLAYGYAHERILPDLYASLARPGGEGTLERRFRTGSVPDVRAKTGTLGDIGVSAIAGYIDHPTAGRYAFCILQQAAPDAGLAVADLRSREEAWLRQFASP